MSKTMSAQASTSPTKRAIATPFTRPSSSPFLPLEFRSPRLPTFSESKGEARLISIPNSGFNSTVLKPNISPDSVSRPRSNSVSTWSPSYIRKLRWRLRRYTLWEAFVFCAFIVAWAILFRALAGVGYEEPEAVRVTSGWRALPPVREHKGLPKISTTDLFESFLRFSGLGRRGVAVEAAKADAILGEEEPEDISVESMSRHTGHRAPDRPRFGASREHRHRMVIAREPSAQLLATDQNRRHPRGPWVEPPPPSPHHDSFHEHFSQLVASAESHDAGEHEGVQQKPDEHSHGETTGAMGVGSTLGGTQEMYSREA